MRNILELTLKTLGLLTPIQKGELTIVISEKRKQKKSSIILEESDKKNIQKND